MKYKVCVSVGFSDRHKAQFRLVCRLPRWEQCDVEYFYNFTLIIKTIIWIITHLMFAYCLSFIIQIKNRGFTKNFILFTKICIMYFCTWRISTSPGSVITSMRRKVVFQPLLDRILFSLSAISYLKTKKASYNSFLKLFYFLTHVNNIFGREDFYFRGRRRVLHQVIFSFRLKPFLLV